MKIMILASERSGTNLLRTLLGKHNKILAPVAPHFYPFFSDIIKKYGSLKNKTNCQLLIKHMLELVNHEFTNWNLEININDTIDKYNIDTFEKAFSALYTEKAIQEGKIHFASKSISLYNYVDNLSSLSEVKFIYLYRDPRDVVTSWLKTPIFMHTVYDIINNWVSEQETIFKLIDDKLPIHMVKYESLIQDTESEMKKLLNYLELDIDENCFSTDLSNKESKKYVMWKNLSKPILTNNFNKYKEKLSKKDILIIETKAKKYMKSLDYNFDSNADWEVKRFTGFGKILRFKRFLSKIKNRKLLNTNMKTLQSKLLKKEKFLSELKKISE